MNSLLRRKVEHFLSGWKNNSERMPLIIKGARQIGKKESIMFFARNNYKYIVNINFVLQEKFESIFNDGFEVDTIIKNISLLEPKYKIEPNQTLFFFDELQACPSCATSLKSFKIDGRYDVICSGPVNGAKLQRNRI